MMQPVADVAVVGAGPAGIAAALQAAEAGAGVTLIDEGTLAGGQIWRHMDGGAVPRDAALWLARLDAAVSSGRVRHLTRTTAADIIAGEPHTISCQSPAGPLHVRARAVILATGARERLLPFAGWTLPGVVGVGGAQALLKSGMDVSGRRVVVAGTGPLLLPVAAALAAAGAYVRLVAEQALLHDTALFALGLWREPRRLLQAAAYRYGFRAAAYRTGTWVVEAHAAADATGTAPLRAVTLTNGRRTTTVDCDLLCVGYGLVPASELARVADCVTDRGFAAVDGSQQTSVRGIYCAGELTHIAGADAAITEGRIAGLAATGGSIPRLLQRQRSRSRAFAARLARTFELRPEVRLDLRIRLRRDTIICRCEDVTHGTLERFDDTREAKLLSRAGMGPCQGRICGAAMQELYGWTPAAVRPPVLPVGVATLMHTTVEDGRA